MDNSGKLPPRSGDWHSGMKHVETGESAGARPSSQQLDHEAAAKWQSHLAESAIVTSAPQSHSPSVAGRKIFGFYSRETHLGDVLIAMTLAVLMFFAVAGTYRGIGHSWDEALYLKPAERAAAWMVGFFNAGDESMLTREAVDRHWGSKLDGNDPLHPEVAPVPKLLDGAGLTYLTGIGLEPMTAMRIPNAILFALTIALLYLLGTREYGRTGGFAAALAYALMPRVFGHAHIAASETPLAFFILLTVWCFLVGNRLWAFALFTGIAFGLAAATKITALILPVPLMLWGQLYCRRGYASNIFAMVFVAPLALLAVWPWLWYDGLHRLMEYIVFYLDHQKTAVFYANRVWGYVHGPAAPVIYPLHITAVALPVWALALLALGLLRALLSTLRLPVSVLFVLMAATWYALSMAPGAPRYDGERLFFPVFPFLALLCGGGFSWLFTVMRERRARRGDESNPRAINVLAGVVLLAIAGYGATTIWRSHPNELNYYNEIVGGSVGAYDQGFETAYWGEGINEDVVDYLNEILKPGDKVKSLALNELALENLRQWGKLPESVDFQPASPPYDYAILQMREGFMGRLERKLYRSRKPLRTFDYHGVPHILVYDCQALVGITQTSADASLTTASLPDEATSATANENLATTGTALAAVLTTETQTAQLDAITTGAAGSTTSSLLTTPVLELDQVTAIPVDTEDDVSTMTVELPATRPIDDETSAPVTYEGNLPTTDSLLNDRNEDR